MISRRPCDKALHDQAIAWLLRLRDESGNADIQKAFADWLAADPAHPASFQKAEEHWAWMETFKTQSFQARDDALRYRPRNRKRLRQRLPVYSTAAALLLGIGFALFSPQGLYGLSQTYSVGKGESQTIALSDGSSLELNTDSEVQVHFNHSQRHVELLRGEAFFTVAHNSKRPFTVNTANVSIRDIGTAFNVYKQTDLVSVSVQEGLVEIKGKAESRQLNANQGLAYSNDDHFIIAKEQDVAAATAWRQGQLIFHGRRLVEVLTEIGRYHDVNIRLPDSRLADLRVNGAFKTEQLDNFLNAVSTLLPLKIKRLSNREIILEEISANR